MRLIQRILLLLIVVIGLSSCGSTFVEEIYLNNNGSGKYQFEMDLSPLMASLKSFGNGLGGDSTKTDKLNKITKMKKDTSFTAYGIIPDSLRHFVTKPELLKKFKIDIKSNDEKNEFVTTVKIDYKNVADISETYREFFSVFAKSTKNDPKLKKFQDAFKNFSGGEWRWEKGILSKTSYKMPTDELDAMDPKEKEQSMAMAKMILAGTKHKLVIHLPKKAKNVSDKNAIVEGKTITIETPILDMLEKKEFPELRIKYKKWLLW